MKPRGAIRFLVVVLSMSWVLVLICGGFETLLGEEDREFKGYPISLNLRDADVATVLHMIAEETGLNLVVNDDVQGKIDIHLVNVPWDQALDEILRAKDLVKLQRGKVIHVSTLEGLKRQMEIKEIMRRDAQRTREEQQRVLEAQETARDIMERGRKLDSMILAVRYADAEELKKNLEPLLSRDPKGNIRGSIQVNAFSNSLVVVDLPEVLGQIESVKAELDQPPQQVLIEARVVKAGKTFARELGVQWGGQYAQYAGSGGTWAYGISGQTVNRDNPFEPPTASTTAPSTWTSGSFTQGTGSDFFPLSSWMVNLPATLLAPSPALGFQVGRLLGDLFGLDIRLSAAEIDGLTKVISRPKIMTLENVEAVIEQGTEIPVTQLSPLGVASTVTYRKASLRTKVTPMISPDGRIHLKLEVTDDLPDFGNRNPVTGDPPIFKRQAVTEVLLKNGETVVLGGVMEDRRFRTEEGVPGLREIPLLGWLFEKKSRTQELNEILIFVTPFLVEDES